MEERYEALKGKLPEIRKLVQDFPENLQPLVLRSLINELRSANRDAQSPETSGRVQRDPERRTANVSGENGQPREIPNVAMLNEQGEFRITLRDLAGKSNNEKARRLAYIIIRAHELLTNTTGVSSRKVVTPILKEWRLYDGNTRGVLAKDKGIQRSGDTVRLDTPGKQEADKFIDEARNPSD